jgi:hypothetical protein
MNATRDVMVLVLVVIVLILAVKAGFDYRGLLFRQGR